MPAEYKKPGFQVRLMNGALGLLIKLGVSPQGGHLLTVRGRKSGKNMTTPVNPMVLDGVEYLVSPRGNTHWARNLRASNQGMLRVGRKRRKVRVVRELPEIEKPPVLLAYLDRWAGVTKSHFGITWPNPSEEEVLRICARTPMFQIATDA